MSAHLHLMGAGGVGMCGLAEVLLADGYTVSGCDLEPSERTDRLQRLGAEMLLGHDAEHIDGADALVVSAAVDRDHLEVCAARVAGLPVVRRSEMLAELMRGRRGVAVAGTHGKTTTTALLGHLLLTAGRDPTVLVGGRLQRYGWHGYRGTGELLVCEADEFDRSFLELGPDISVITNLEPEHLDCYADEIELQRAFAAFANRTSALGTVVLCADDPGAAALAPMIRRRVLRYGTVDSADLRAVAVAADGRGSRFTVMSHGTRLGELRLALPGAHNVVNALAAITAGLELEIPFDELADGCAGFAGVGRRFEIRGDRDGVTVVDDYAHHPTELRAVFEAARAAFPERRLVAVFQPHLYSRTRDFATGFAGALLDADVALVLPIYPARERPISGVDARLVVDEAVRLGHPRAMSGPPMADAAGLFEEIARPGDVLLLLGAGDVHRLADTWLGGTA